MQNPPSLPASRPTILTVAAVLCLIFGVIGMLGSIPALLAFAGVQFGAHDPMTAAMLADPVIQTFQKIGGLLGAVAGAVVVAAGIGLLKCREWARKTVIAWSLYSMLSTVVGTWLTVVHVLPAMQKGLHEQMQGMGQNGAVGVKVGMVAGMASAAAGLLFGVGLAVTLIVLVTRAKSKAACRPASAA